MKGVPFVNRRSSKGVPFRPKLVYKKVSGWTSCRSLPIKNFIEYPETLSEDWDDRETIIFIPVIESKFGLDGAEVEKK